MARNGKEDLGHSHGEGAKPSPEGGAKGSVFEFPDTAYVVTSNDDDRFLSEELGKEYRQKGVVVGKPAIEEVVFPTEEQQEEELPYHLQRILQDSPDRFKMVFFDLVNIRNCLEIVLHEGG